MSNQFFQDTISVLSKHTEATFELATDREILLADYDRPVFKIVKTLAEHSITQKYINGNRLVLEGFFRISVLYQPPQGEALTVISKKQPFQKQLELSEPVTGPYFVTVHGEPQYVNTRAINPARIAVNGIYSFDVQLFTAASIPVVTSIDSSTACTDTEELRFFTLCAANSKQFSMEDEITVPENTDKILHISAGVTDITAIAYGDKVNVKGEIEAEIVYSLQNSQDINFIRKKFMFNQLADMQGVSENNVAYADMAVTSVTVTGNSETGRVNCILTANTDIKVFRKNSVFTVLDAFSQRYASNKNLKNITYDRAITEINKKVTHTVADNIGGGYTPVHSFVSLSAPFLSAVDGENRLKTRYSVNAIVRNINNEYECFTKSGDMELDVAKDIGAGDEYAISCHITDRHMTISGDTLKVDFTASVCGFITARQPVTVLETFEEIRDTAIATTKDTLILYYATKGEKVFDIAMKYHTDIQQIMAENNITAKTLPEDRMLIIPAFD